MDDPMTTQPDFGLSETGDMIRASCAASPPAALRPLLDLPHLIRTRRVLDPVKQSEPDS
jgi:hypothetical protein